MTFDYETELADSIGQFSMVSGKIRTRASKRSSSDRQVEGYIGIVCLEHLHRRSWDGLWGAELLV